MALAGILRQSTAVDILLGPFVDDADGKTAEAGLTLDVEVSKNGQALANKNDATTPVHDAAGTIDGYYNCELDTTDTGTLGTLTVVAYAAGALPVRVDYAIITAQVWDSFFSTDLLDVNAAQWLGTACATPTVAGVPEVDVTHIGGVAQSATDLKDFADTGYDPTAHKVQGVVLADTCTTNSDMVGTDNAALASVLGAAVGASISADIAAVKAETLSLDGTKIPGIVTAAGPTKAQMDTAHGLLATPAQVATALTTYDAPTKAELDTAQAAIIAEVDANESKIDTIDTNVDSILTDTNELQTDWANDGRLDVILDAAGGAGDPWITALPGAYGAGTAGKIVGDNINAPIATVDTVVDGIQTDLSNVTDGLGALKILIEAVGGDATAANQELLIKILTGKWEITNNQLIMYDTDGTTALYTFNLTQGGTASQFNPDLRTPV